MGVTLERVQNKFACIIGELSSEPDILSQFTIWVDLRIAEFKTKGTISLDCSGENPNPAWLRGFKPESKVKDGQGPNLIQSGSHFLHRVTSDRLSPDVQEENVDIYLTKIRRKRPASSAIGGTSTSPEESDGYSPSKVKRDNDASYFAEPVNESLMSIIGSDSETDHQVENSPSLDLIKSLDSPSSSSVFTSRLPSKGDHTGTTQSITGAPSSDPISDGVVSDEKTLVQAEKQATSSPAIYRVNMAHVNKGSNSPEGSASNRAVPTSSSGSSTPRRSASELYPAHFPERLSNNVIRTRIIGYENKPTNSTVNTVKTVGTLERWLWSRYNENRNVETIPPAELDEYLAEFFQILQKPNGLDYTADSMSNLRCSLERFLKDHMYPCSISKSQEFAKSRQVFTERRRSLASERFQMEKRSIQEEWNSKIL